MRSASNNQKDIPNDIKLYNAIDITEDNPSIERIKEKCIDCGLCKTICETREGIKDICNGKACVYCGQCIQMCPVNALVPKNHILNLKLALNNKVCIVYTAPAVRVAIGEAFEMPKGSFAQGKLVSALRKLGFKYVLDVTSSADLTIVEEASELVKRIKTNDNLPMFTSCCPSWVKYTENFYPELLSNLSTCKSPISMQGTIVKEYFCQKLNLDKNEIFTVAVTPCTAKKFEISREELPGTDLVITTKELIDLLRLEKIDFKNLEDGEFDNIFGEGSGAGMIFGSTGGVMEASIRTVYKILTDRNLPLEKLEFKQVRGLKNVKELTINIEGFKINVAVVNQMSSAIPLLEDVKNGKSKYHYIEVMNCLGGCIGGGGQPRVTSENEFDIKQKRMDALFARDKERRIRLCHQNTNVVRLYNELLEEPLSPKANELLHTYYIDRSHDIEE